MATSHVGAILDHIRSFAEIHATRSLSDGQLLQRFTVKGDGEAFATLMRRHGRLVWTICRHILPSEHDAEDAFQAAFLVLARRAASIRKTEAVAEWLHGVAYRIAVRAKQMAAKRLGRERQAAAAAKRLGDRAIAAAPPDGVLRELQELLQEEVAQLPEKYRTPFVMCCLEGRCWREVAAELGWKEGTLATRIARARKLLQMRLARHGVTLSAALTAGVLGNDAASAALIVATRQAAMRLASGGALPAITTPAVASLVETGLRTFGPMKTKFATALLLAAITLTGSVTFAVTHPQTAGAPSKEGVVGAVAQSDKAEARLVRTDAHGDQLPDGAIRRLGTLRFRQGGGQVNRLLISRDGKTLVSKSYYGERSVCVWEFPTGKLRHQFAGHYDENRAVALTPDGKTLAVGREAVISFYDLDSGKEARQFKSPRGETQGLAFSANGKLLASGHNGQTVSLWDVASGKEIANLPAQHNGSGLLAFSPDGKTLATGDTLDKTIRLFDVETRKERHQLRRPSFVHDLAFSPDSSTLAAGGNDGTVPLWEVASGKLVRELRGPFSYASAVAWSPDGKTLASSEYDEKGEVEYIRFWDSTTGEERSHIGGSMGLIRSLAFTADGKTLIGGGGGIVHLWDVSSGEERPPAKGNDTVVWALAVSPDGKTLAYGGTDVHLWDISRAHEVGTLPGHHWSFAFSPDGQRLAGGSGVNFVNLWDVPGRRLVRRLETDLKKDGLKWVAHYKTAFSPDGKLLASGSRDLRTAGGVDGIVRLWDLATGKEMRRLSMLHAAERYCGEPEAVAFAPDGRTLIASGRAEPKAGKVRVWDTATGKERTEIEAAMNSSLGTLDGRRFTHSEIVTPRVVFSPDGRLLAMNCGSKGIPVWEAVTGQERCRLEGHEAATVCVAWSPDGRTLASSGYDYTIRLWDLDSGTELRKLTGHRGKANALAFTSDGKTLISGGDDTTILFWDVASVTRREPLEVRLTPQQWDALWKDLAGADSAAAHKAMTRLIASPDTTAALKERLHAAPKLDANRLERLLGDLDSAEFAVRENATRAIEKLGEAACEAIERALARTEVSAEARRRLEGLQGRLAVPTGEPLRELRALEVLERLSTPEARQLIEKLANGAPDARLTREAKTALQRLQR
jgi:RNA polymerase sigma factor (sigma-70 family)